MPGGATGLHRAAPWQVLQEAAVAAIGHLPRKLISPEERLFWPYLLGSGVIAAGVWLHHQRRAASGSLPPARQHNLWRWLLPAGALRSTSVRMDLWLALVWGGLRSGLKALWLAGPLALSSLGAVLWLLSVLPAWLGPTRPLTASLSLPPGLAAWLYTITLFVVWDAARFTLHLLMHRVEALWQIHQVHHAAEVLTPLTLHRSHPVEALLFGLTQWLVTVLLSTAAVRLFGPGISEVELWGVNAVGFVFSLLGGNLRHSHATIAYPPWLERLILSPAQHQLHHSEERALQESNFGIWLACWDRLAGSHRVSAADQVVRFGVRSGDLNHDPTSLRSSLLDPLRAMLSRARRARMGLARLLPWAVAAGLLLSGAPEASGQAGRRGPASGHRVVACRADGDCAGTRLCRRGRCYEVECEADADCPGERLCRAYRCLARDCTLDAHCDIDRRCDDGVCVVPAPPRLRSGHPAPATVAPVRPAGSALKTPTAAQAGDDPRMSLGLDVVYPVGWLLRGDVAVAGGRALSLGVGTSPTSGGLGWRLAVRGRPRALGPVSADLWVALLGLHAGATNAPAAGSSGGGGAVLGASGRGLFARERGVSALWTGLGAGLSWWHGAHRDRVLRATVGALVLLKDRYPADADYALLPTLSLGYSVGW